MYDTNEGIKTIEDVIRISLQYDFIGISSNSLSFPSAIKIAQEIKNKKNIPIVLGGYHGTFAHESIIRNFNCFDFIIRGEGENAIVELCQDYYNNNAVTRIIEGITYKNFGGKTILSDTVLNESDLDSLSFPCRDFHSVRYVHSKGNRKACVTVLSSRGCPYNCKFCSVTKFRKKWNGRSPDNVAKEIYELYVKYGDLYIVFIDDNFYIDPLRSKEILVKIEEYCGRTFEFSFCTRADQIINNGPDFLSFFMRWGCSNIEVGIENGSDRMLKLFNKNTSSKQNIEAIKMLRNVGIYPAIDFILFEPSTTINDLNENIEFFKAANLWGYQYPLIYNRVICLPGTEYYDEMEIINDNYFTDARVSKIYDCISSFRKSYQHKIDALVDAFNTSVNYNLRVSVEKKDYLWFCRLPYEILKILVNSNDDIMITYSEFLKSNNVNEMFDKYSSLIVSQ